MSEMSVRARGLSKVYHVYDRPQDRLWQALIGRRRQLYREFWALRGVDFEVARGETVGIVGRNGSGKSTLLQLVAGTLQPTAGEVETRGRVAALLELGSGFNPEFTGRDNVMFSGALFGIDARGMAERFDRIAAFADIGDFIDQPVKSYSSGMTMRLAFSVMAHVDAEVLIIDEALAVGDAYFSQKCMRFLREFRERGTLLFVSHDTAAVTALCDRAIWLDRGAVRAIGDAKEVSEAYLEDVFAGRQDVATVAAVHRAEAAREPRHDLRRELYATSNLRNDIQVIDFDPVNARGFGASGMAVESVALRDGQGRSLAWIVGGEIVTLAVDVVARQPVRSVIVGFYLKDRLGQFVFGDNTYLVRRSAPVALADGERARATFTFQMPRLRAGDYWFSIGVAEGTQAEHVQHHWVHEALHLKAEAGDVVTGLVGLPMYDISLEPIDG